MFLLCMLMAANPSGAEIEWEQTEASVQVHPAQVSCEAVYRFINKGDAAVSISSVQTTCGCLRAKADKENYAAGEHGQVVVDFDLRGRVGSQRKYTTVFFDDETSVTLVMTVEIPEMFHADAQLLKWDSGDDAKQKTVHLENRNSMPVRILSIHSSHEDLPAALRTIRDGYEYEVMVTRVPGVKQVRAVISLETEPPPGMQRSKVQYLYVVVY